MNNETDSEPWIMRTIALALSGLLGMWGTLTLWNCGIRYETQLWISSTNPKMAFFALLACVASVFLLGIAVRFDHDE